MKKIVFGLSAVVLVAFTSCNSGNNKSSEVQDSSKMNIDTTVSKAAESQKMAEVTHRFTDVDPKLAASLKPVVDHYLHIKNALVNNNGEEAASGGKAMAEALGKIDPSLFTTDQKKVYDGVKEDLKEHGEHISDNAGKIDHQREHFSMMSEDVYDLVKAFGAGRVVYHDHCPMANDNKGGMWLSETKEVKNPYFGGKMNECVTIPEMIN